MQLMRGRTTSLALTERTPLNDYAHEGPDGAWGLYSNDNQRLISALMYQACRRRWDEVCEVWCRVLGRIPAGGQWPPDAHYEGTDGLSIGPRLGLDAKALHRGLLRAGERQRKCF